MRFLVFACLWGTAASAAELQPVSASAPSTWNPSQALLKNQEGVGEQEKLSRGTAALTAMRAALRDVVEKLQEARRTRDIIKLNCVNEKLTRVKALLRVSEQSEVSLQEAVARSDGARSDREYTRISMAEVKINTLRAEAEQCIGQLAFLTDENLSLEVETPRNLPKEDPTSAWTEPGGRAGGLVPRPPAASPVEPAPLQP